MLASLIAPTLLNAQVRPDINSFTSTQKADLANLIIDYVDNEILEYHCNYSQAPWNALDIHSDFDFLPFHRVYLEGLEDSLIRWGRPEFVPLPYWDPLTPAPMEFRTAGPDSNGIDPDCATPTCRIVDGPCDTIENWEPTVRFPRALSLPIQSGSQNDLCDWEMDPVVPSSRFCCPDGLSRQIEVPWHNPVHAARDSGMRGVMGNFRSPAAAIFWIWHAYVDDVWKTWECNCIDQPSNTTSPVDLYMKDTPKVMRSERDRGEEPNIDTGFMWHSRDIWIRRQNDGLTNHEHQDPEYSSDSNTFNYVYVQVRNRGCVAARGELVVHWAKAGTWLPYPSHWNGSLTTSNGQPLGDTVNVILTPLIQPGASHIVEIPWQPVDPANYANLYDSTDSLFWIPKPEPHHFCLLARIVWAADSIGTSLHDPISYTDGSEIGRYVRRNNNVIWKNFSVVDLQEDNVNVVDGALSPGAMLFVGNALGTGGTFDLEFTDPRFYHGNPVTAEADVTITLSTGLWDKWEDGGYLAENIEIISAEEHRVVVTGSPAWLKNLTFAAHERNLLHVGFNFMVEELSGKSLFDYHVVQRKSSDNQVVGGETYRIKIPEDFKRFYADAGADVAVSPGDSSLLSASEIGEGAIYKWYDPAGELLHTGREVTVSPSVTGKYRLEVIAEADGLKGYDEVTVRVKEFEILSISPNPTTDEVTIGYRADAATSAHLMVTIPYSGASHDYVLDVGEDEITIDVSDYGVGTYSVILVCNGEGVDASGFVVQ